MKSYFGRGRLYLSCAVAGGVAGMAMAPYGYIAALMCLAVLLWALLKTERWYEGSLMQGLFAAAFYLPQLSWIREAVLVDAAQFGWLALPTLLGIPLYLALYQAAAGGLFTFLYTRLAAAHGQQPLIAAALFAGLWGAADLLQGHMAVGFPWALPVYALDAWPALQQAHSVLGAYALNALLVGAAAALPVFAAQRLFKAVLLLTLCVALSHGWGAARLSNNSSVSRETSDAVRVRLIQPNIEQRLKWQRDEVQATLEVVAALLETPVPPVQGMPQLVILPEAVVPVLLQDAGELRRRLTAKLAPEALLLLGGHRFDGKHYFNSLLVLDSRGALTDYYDKHHLVPFGEYIPLRSVLPLDTVAPLPGDFGRGEGVKALRLFNDTVILWPSICFEAVFSGAVRRGSNATGMLLQITNDAWFGRSAGPYQHFVIARTRAIEEGLPLLRVANTGISAVIDSHGRIQQQLALETRGVLDAAVPAPATALFPRWRWVNVAAPLLLLLPALILLAAAALGRYRDKPH